MITSVSRGFHSFLPNCSPPRSTFSSCSPGAPLYSSIRCIVWASQPVASVILLAARPVGAASIMLMPCFSKQRMIMLMVVVFPVPGPPVTTRSPLCMASFTAILCWSSSSSSSWASRLAICFMAYSSSLSSGIFRSHSILAQFSSA